MEFLGWSKLNKGNSINKSVQFFCISLLRQEKVTSFASYCEVWSIKRRTGFKDWKFCFVKYLDTSILGKKKNVNSNRCLTKWLKPKLQGNILPRNYVATGRACSRQTIATSLLLHYKERKVERSLLFPVRKVTISQLLASMLPLHITEKLHCLVFTD